MLEKYARIMCSLITTVITERKVLYPRSIFSWLKLSYDKYCSTAPSNTGQGSENNGIWVTKKVYLKLTKISD